MKLFYMVFIGLLFSSNAIAVEDSNREVLTLQHPEISEPLHFNIALPEGYSEQKEKRYLVMFDFHPLSDGYLTGMHNWMSHNGEWPWLKTIIITPASGNTVWKLWDETGKTHRLLDFFAQQLFPTVDKKYRTHPFRMISGFRTNGSIVLSALLNRPDIFNAYIAVAPELKNDTAAILSTVDTKIKKLDDKPRFLLVSHSESIKEDHQQSEAMLLKTSLVRNSPASLDLHHLNLAQHYHMSQPLLATIHAVERLFDDIHNGLDANSEIAQQGVDAIMAHYQWLSKEKYGFEVSPKRSIKNLGLHRLEQSPNAGIKVFEEMRQHYPKDAYSYYYLAKAFASKGELQTAIKHQETAAELAKSMATWHQKRMQRFLEQYQKQAKL